MLSVEQMGAVADFQMFTEVDGKLIFFTHLIQVSADLLSPKIKEISADK